MSLKANSSMILACCKSLKFNEPRVCAFLSRAHHRVLVAVGPTISRVRISLVLCYRHAFGILMCALHASMESWLLFNFFFVFCFVCTCSGINQECSSRSLPPLWRGPQFHQAVWLEGVPCHPVVRLIGMPVPSTHEACLYQANQELRVWHPCR